jgi:hypothetical protein
VTLQLQCDLTHLLQKVSLCTARNRLVPCLATNSYAQFWLQVLGGCIVGYLATLYELRRIFRVRLCENMSLFGEVGRIVGNPIGCSQVRHKMFSLTSNVSSLLFWEEWFCFLVIVSVRKTEVVYVTTLWVAKIGEWSTCAEHSRREDLSLCHLVGHKSHVSIVARKMFSARSFHYPHHRR